VPFALDFRSRFRLRVVRVPHPAALIFARSPCTSFGHLAMYLSTSLPLRFSTIAFRKTGLVGLVGYLRLA
jgi:hypothetical protein